MTPERCPLCGRDAVEAYWPTVWEGPGQQVYRCAFCQVLFLWPVMAGEELSAYYAGYATHLARRGVVEDRESPLQTFERRARLFSYRWEALGPFVPAGCRALEIGGGCGNFIGELWRQGRFASAALVESCAAHLDFARDRFAGLTCASTLDELETGSFDILFLLHVFEHLTDPVGAARHFARLLAPGGRICLEVPCAADPLLSLYGCAAYKDFYFQPMHPFVHCQDSLRVAFGEAGFVARAFLPVQRYPLSNHAEWLARGRPGGNPSLARIFGEETESAYKRAMERNGTADTLFAIFEQSTSGA